VGGYHRLGVRAKREEALSTMEDGEVHGTTPFSNGGTARSGHHHGLSGSADQRYLLIAFGLIVAFMVFEVAMAFVSGSLALLSDAGHMLTDAGALMVSIWAVRMAARPAIGQWTFGFKRAEVLSAALNGITLLVIAALVCFEAIERLLHPTAVDGTIMIVVAGVGVVVNLGATLVLAKADRASLNIAGAFAHILTDLWAFIGTLAAGIVIVTTGFARADALASLLVVGLMLYASWGLLRESGRVLFEAAPKTMDLSEVDRHLRATDGVLGIHDLHAWVVASDLPALSAHVTVSEESFAAGRVPRLLDELQACLLGHFDVEHSTFQLELPEHRAHEQGHHD
jgi:cobalt-zinc-cadmium efflux system protein